MKIKFKTGDRVWLWGDIKAVVIKSCVKGATEVRITSQHKGLRCGDRLLLKNPNQELEPRTWGEKR